MNTRLVFLLLLALSQIATAAPPLLDSAWRGYDTGIFANLFGPQCLAAGDIDGDGDIDVVSAMPTSPAPACRS